MLVAFTFHRITDSEKSGRYYMFYEKGMDYRVFDRQISAITRYFNVIDLDEFSEIVRGKSRPARHAALLTFDDADSEFIDYALPILVKYRLPAVMFVPTDFIETDKRFWHLRVSNIVRQMTPRSWAEIQRRDDIVPDTIKHLIARKFPDSEPSRAALALDLNHNLDKVDIRDVHKCIELWEEIAVDGFDMQIKCMSWEQLKIIHESKVRVESHSVSHGKLADLDLQEIRNELACSKKTLESRLSETVTAVSYPAGSYNQNVMKTARETGYSLGFTTETGICDYPISGDDLFKLRRYNLYGDSPDEIDFVLGILPLKSLLRKAL